MHNQIIINSAIKPLANSQKLSSQKGLKSNSKECNPARIAIRIINDTGDNKAITPNGVIEYTVDNKVIDNISKHVLGSIVDKKVIMPKCEINQNESITTP